MIDQRKRIFAFNVWLFDLLLTAASFLMAYRFRSLFELEGHTVMPVQIYLWLLAIILPTWAFLLPIFGVYSEPGLRPLHQILRLSKAIGFAWLVMLAVQFFVNQDQTNRLIVLFTLVINYLLLVSYRVILFKITKKGVLDVRHVAVVGVGPTAMQVASNIEDHRDWGLDLVGVFNQEEVRSILESGGIDELILLAERDSLNEFTQTFLMCEELGVTARVILNFLPHSIARMELHQFEGFPLLSFSTTPTNEALLLIRRILDVALAGFLLVVTLPLSLLTAVLIKLSSPGPVLFRQERCGLNGRPFVMYKFRSMVDNAEQLRFELEALNEMDGPVFKSSRDPRITLIGKIIRRFSIDELPQLFNVLRGNMSLVGHGRPCPRKWHATSAGNAAA